MKVLVIGLDAATMDLIEPWAEVGHLPTLAGLMREGASARLLSTPNMHSASAWTSILTGLNPGRHGLFVFSDRDFVTGRQEFFKGGDRTGELITSHLARQGMTAGLLNVPMTYPAESHPGGYMISGLDAPSLDERAFSPAELRRELLDKFPDYNFTPPGLGDLMNAGRIDDATLAWMKLTETQTAAAEYLMSARPTDFFMTVYTASDWGGHNLWAGVEQDDVKNHKNAGEGKAGTLLSIYRALDRSIARLLRHAGERTQVYVISDHGMGPHTGASYHLAEWLESRGYMSRVHPARNRASLISAGRGMARSLLPVSIRERIKSGIGGDRLKRLQVADKDSFYSSIDWARTRAYTEPGRHVININLAGRNARGCVPRAEYDKVCAQIIEDLRLWTDARGARVVEHVARRDEVYFGPFQERASDLYIYWNAAADLREPPPEVRARGFWWSGDHRPEGVLICKGEGIRRGARLNPPSVYDLLPTLMYAAQLPVPENLDGKVIQQACADDFIARNPVRVGSSLQAQPPDRGGLSETEERLIEEKLRGLGYL